MMMVESEHLPEIERLVERLKGHDSIDAMLAELKLVSVEIAKVIGPGLPDADVAKLATLIEYGSLCETLGIEGSHSLN